ncbi:hypothetical protein FGB62_76g061 [Gracilaria domingensis]|nr:hypothetical protein FGB62_76g061 [Gracilaria domingensis]
MSFQLSLKRAAARRKRGRVHGTALIQPRSVASAFGKGDDSEDSEDAPQARKVTTISAPVEEKTEAQASQQPKEEQGELPDDNKSDTKTSQIANIVKRRKEANIAATVPRDQRDEALFRYEVASCPDEADIHLYEQRPVDGFGAMILKSMGWNGKETLEEKYDAPIPRPNRLGLGAKPSALKKPMRRKRLREAENKTDSPPDLENGQNLKENNDVGVTANSKPLYSEVNHAHTSKRLRG